MSGESVCVLPLKDKEPGDDIAPETKVQSPGQTKKAMAQRKRKLPGRKQRLSKRMKIMKEELTSIKKQQIEDFCRLKPEGIQRFVIATRT